jgi:predicted RNA-binding Zn-ribbon protein involved in translation (DUF1610 family)
MNAENVSGVVYRCPVCGAEVTAVGSRMGEFTPRCCNRPMRRMSQRATLYDCPVCGAAIVIVRKGRGRFEPRCCNHPMAERRAA